MNEIGNRISICRQNKNMTQEELAKRLGVTSQAVSKYERGSSLPDVSMVKGLCDVLEISSDYLLGIKSSTGKSDIALNGSEDISKNLKNSLEQVELVIGRDLVPLFLDGRFENEIRQIRLRVSREGILLPIIRVRDHAGLKANEFMVLAYDNVLHAEEVNLSDSNSLTCIMNTLERVVRQKYAEILNPDIIKLLVDNLKDKYSALIDGMIPEKISYSKLTAITKAFLNRGNGILYLPRIIELMQYHMLDNPNAATEELTKAVIDGIESGKNIWVYLANRG